jgi:hypothetical protein
MGMIEHWLEWRARCALGLCGEETRAFLLAFSYARFRHFVIAYAQSTNVPNPDDLTPEPAQTWHWFETYFQLHPSRQGKAFKAWIFERPDVPAAADLDTVQRAATLLMREVVRDYLRREFSCRRVRSLDATPGGATPPGSAPAPSLQELLPSPLDTGRDVEQRDLERLAEQDAAAALSTLNDRERLALLVRQLNLSLAHPAVTQAAGCGKSVMNTAFHNALAGLAAHVRSRHPRDDVSTLATLTCLVYDRVKPHILSWGKSENACARIFLLVES